MAINRKKALERLGGLLPRVEEHLAKIAENPGDIHIPHWTHEVNDWLRQMEEMVPHVGTKSGARWSAIIDDLRRRLGG
jgi:hypothetical protein